MNAAATATATPVIEVRKNAGGWGQQFRSWTDRPYAAFVNGAILRDARGFRRTFGSRAAAEKAAADHLAARAAG